MNGNCHFIYGAALGTAIAINLDSISTVLPNIHNSPEAMTLFVLGGVLGGVLPDIDNPVSHIGKLTAPVSSALGVIGKVTGKTGKNHRGILHDPITYIIGLILSYLYFPPTIGLFVGCFSHLLLDIWNPSGIPFLFGVKHLHLGRIVSGSTASVVFTWVSVFLVTGAGIAMKLLILPSIL